MWRPTLPRPLTRPRPGGDPQPRDKQDEPSDAAETIIDLTDSGSHPTVGAGGLSDKAGDLTEQPPDDSGEAAGAQPRTSLRIPLDIPVPGRLNAATVRRYAASAGRLAILSPRSDRLPAPIGAAWAALWAAAVGMLTALLITVVSGVIDPGVGPASLVWLVAHHAPLTTDSGTVTLLPLGLLLLTVPPLRRAGRFLVAQAAGPLQVTATLAGIGYVVIAVFAAWSHPELPSVALFRAAVWAALLVVVAGGWGVQRQRLGRLPRPPFVAGVAVSVALPLAVATVLCLVSIVTAAPQILDTQARVASSGTDQVGLVLVQLAYLPNLILWAAAFVIGPGISLGADHVLSPFVASPAVVPDLPVLAAVPVDPPNWTALLPIVVALSGACGSLVFARLLPEARLRRRITRALTLAAVSGLVWWVLLSLAGGSLGDGRLEALGPVAGAAFVGALLTAAGSLMWALLPTLASDDRPVATDLKDRVATAAKDGRIPVGRRSEKSSQPPTMSV